MLFRTLPRIAAAVLLFCTFSISNFLYAQMLGKPFIQNFSPTKYKADGQNWAVAQDNRGVIYVGNTIGLLEYDGVSWRLIPTPNEEVVRRLLKGPDGSIYLSTSSEFGFLASDKTKGLYFHSLKDHLDEADKTNSRIDEIFEANNGIYFMSRQAIYYWFGGKMEVIRAKEGERFEQFFGLGNRVFVLRKKSDDTRVFEEVIQAQLIGMPNSQAVGRLQPTKMEQYTSGIMLMSTPDKGFYLYDESQKGRVKKFKTDVDTYISENGLRKILKLADGNFVFGTTTGGLVLLNSEGKLLQKVGKESGLFSDEVYTMYEDDQHGLWLALGHGISRVELSAPISKWDDEVGGWTTSIIKHKGKIYSASFGAYCLTENGFKQIDGLNRTSQSWRFIEFTLPKSNDKVLLLATNDGIFEVEGLNAKRIYDKSSRLMSLFQSTVFPERLYIGGISGDLHVVEREGKDWKPKQVINTKVGQIRFIEEENNGNLWMSTFSSGVASLQFKDPESLEVKEIKTYGEEKGLPSEKYTVPFKRHGITHITTEKGLYAYNQQKDMFELCHQPINDVFSEGERGVMYLKSLEENKLLLSPYKTGSKQSISEVILKDGKAKWEDTPFKRLPSMEVEEIAIDGNIVWIGGSEGVFRFNKELARDYNKPYTALIRKVMIGKDSLVYNGAYVTPGTIRNGNNLLSQPKGEFPIVPFSNNTVSFDFAAPSFDNSEDANEYQYKLEGFDDQWSDWTATSHQAYTNLSPGQYVFKVKSRNVYGAISDEASFKFMVTSPWYMSIVAYFTYVMMAGATVYGVVKWNTRRLKVQNRTLETLVEKRTAEIESQKNQIQKAYNNIKTIGDIGQKITVALDMEVLIETVYHNINSLMDASAFGVGVFNEEMNRLDFIGFIENGKKLPNSFDHLTEDDKFSVLCFNRLQPIFINNMEEEYNHYIDGEIKANIGEMTKSLIYLPLIIENKPIGVITVQSLSENAYSTIDLTILQTLASYVAIALSNTNSFRVIKEKNLQITDSIRYAETIQKAVLPSIEKMRETLHEFFVLWMPKDIVSGDFYWFNHIDDRIYLAVVDCTGHGVPGAFMSMIGTSSLNDIVNVNKVYSPAKILEQLHLTIRAKLKQYEAKNMDGMDISLCMLEPHDDFDMKLTFAGAKQPLYYVKDGKFCEIKGDRKSIGGMQRENKREFTDHEVILSAGDSLYLLSDGYIDQNNPDRKKIGSMRLKELLMSIRNQSMDNQRQAMLTMLEEHQKGAPQRDDITVMAVKV
ncbi:SpoIIE family protein phosphatase [Limibacter armeniacum]|uniref:SpoIIE family protein phosphatase n=1 Tax=Limibacter armeniacum TaxID=466084 RepID=UPI002FE5FD49